MVTTIWNTTLHWRCWDLSHHPEFLTRISSPALLSSVTPSIIYRSRVLPDQRCRSVQNYPWYPRGRPSPTPLSLARCCFLHRRCCSLQSHPGCLTWAFLVGVELYWTTSGSSSKHFACLCDFFEAILAVHPDTDARSCLEFFWPNLDFMWRWCCTKPCISDTPKVPQGWRGRISRACCKRLFLQGHSDPSRVSSVYMAQAVVLENFTCCCAAIYINLGWRSLCVCRASTAMNGKKQAHVRIVRVGWFVRSAHGASCKAGWVARDRGRVENCQPAVSCCSSFRGYGDSGFQSTIMVKVTAVHLVEDPVVQTRKGGNWAGHRRDHEDDQGFQCGRSVWRDGQGLWSLPEKEPTPDQLAAGGTKKGTKYAGTHAARRNLPLYSENHFRTAWRGPFAHKGNPGTFRCKNSTEFLLTTDPRVRLCERTLPNRLRKVRKSHRRKKARTRRLRSKRRPTRSPLHARTPWTKKRTRSNMHTDI